MVKKLDPSTLETHKARRLQHKSVSSSLNTVCVTPLIVTLRAEDTRYTNPLKRKFKAKRLAAECMDYPQPLYPPIFLPRHFSRCRCCPCHEETERPDARRIPTTKQDPFLAESSRDGHKGSAQHTFLSVPQLARSSSGSVQEGHRLRRILGRRECYRRKRCPTQLQTGRREQNQGMSIHPALSANGLNPFSQITFARK